MPGNQVPDINDTIDNQCDLSLSILEQEENTHFSQFGQIKKSEELRNNQIQNDNSRETVITRTLQENLVPFQFKKDALQKNIQARRLSIGGNPNLNLNLDLMNKLN